MKKSDIRLRDYQLEGKQSVFDYSLTYQRIMLVMPTGTGKTTVFSSIISDALARGKTILVGVHRIELVEQIHRRLLGFGIHSGIIAAGTKANRYKPVQVASIQTLSRRDAPPADFVIIDECHHTRAASYVNLWKLYPKAFFLGVTATPVRLNGEGFKDLFDYMYCLHSLPWYIQRGYLVKPKTYAGFNTNVKQIPTQGYDYDPAKLNEYLITSRYETDLYNSYIENAEGLKTIVFAPSREISNQIVDIYQSGGFPAAHIDAMTPKNERKSILRKFSEGKILILSNVDIVSEGFDVPDTECVQLARPTKSLSLYMQQVGRVLRPVEGKTEGLVIDNVGNWSTHNLLPGNDVAWSLDAKPKRIFEGRVGYKIDGKISLVPPAEIEYAELLEITPELEWMITFDSIYESVEEEMGSPSENTAITKYIDYLELQGEKFDDTHMSLIKERIGQYSKGGV